MQEPESVLHQLGGIIDEIYADWKTGGVFISSESLKPVLRLERAGDRHSEFEPDDDVKAQARAIMIVALNEYRKAP